MANLAPPRIEIASTETLSLPQNDAAVVLPSLECLGERVHPEAYPADILQEHAARYLFAARYCGGKDVLDVASGIGYGTDFLQKQGARASGLEIDDAAVHYSRARYPGARYVCGTAEMMPATWNEAFDVVVSFETIEHLPQAAAFLDEVRRCLKPGGLFMCSTPNKSLYGLSSTNKFHFKEYYLEEFIRFIGTRFRIVEVVGQSCHPNWHRFLLVPRALASRLLRALHIPPLGITRHSPDKTVLSPFSEGSIAESKILPRFMPCAIPRGSSPEFVIVVGQKDSNEK
jgi:SAM-dependent methyltransferase